MPQPLIDGFLKVNNDRKALLNMFNKDVQKMKGFKDWSDAQMKAIKQPALIMNGDKDVGSVEHAVEMYRIMPDAQLAILPGKHGACIGAVEFLDNRGWTQHFVVDLINDFLDEE
jgi:pimeloyl-ACP methyl ester carboxylesterase